LTRDFDNDGLSDLATANFANNALDILLGYGEFHDYPVGESPLSIAAGDFKNDTINVFLGNGDGNFQSQGTYPVGNCA